MDNTGNLDKALGSLKDVLVKDYDNLHKEFENYKTSVEASTNLKLLEMIKELKLVNAGLISRLGVLEQKHRDIERDIKNTF